MRLVMLGTGTFAAPTFEALFATRHQVVGLVTQPDRPPGKERSSTRQAGRGLKDIAHDHGVPVRQPGNINQPEEVAQLRAWQPDLLVVAAYGQILSRAVLATAAQGGINVHGSLLPKYRGAAPVVWAICHGETRTGVTILKIAAALDAGDILAQEALDIGPEETAGAVEARLAPLGAKLAVGVIEQIAAGTIHGVKQDQSQVTRAPKLTKEHGLIAWDRPATQVCNQVRAMQPWPTAYTYLHRPSRPPLRVIVIKAVEFPLRQDPAAPWGTIIVEASFPHSLLVTAGLLLEKERSVVEVLELQPVGKRPMGAADFLRGHPLSTEAWFGPEQP